MQAHAANNPLPVDPPPHPSFEDLPSDLQASILDGVQNGMDLSFDELRLKTALPPYAGKAPWSYKDFADAGSSPVTSASTSQAPTTPVPSKPPTGPMSNGRASAPHRLNSPDGYLSYATQQDVKRRQPHF